MRFPIWQPREGVSKKSGDDRGNGGDQAKQTELGQVGADGLFSGCPETHEDGHVKGPLGQERMKKITAPQSG